MASAGVNDSNGAMTNRNRFDFCGMTTFPRYRYDQIMRLGWKVFIPITIIWIVVEGVLAYLQVGPWSNLTG